MVQASPSMWAAVGWPGLACICQRGTAASLHSVKVKCKHLKRCFDDSSALSRTSRSPAESQQQIAQCAAVMPASASRPGMAPRISAAACHPGCSVLHCSKQGITGLTRWGFDLAAKSRILTSCRALHCGKTCRSEQRMHLVTQAPAQVFRRSCCGQPSASESMPSHWMGTCAFVDGKSC